MDTRLLTEETIWKDIEHANEMASNILRLPLGGCTNEDVVAEFLLDKLRQGMTLEQIVQILRGPKGKRYRYLTNKKNDRVRHEKRKKRGSGVPVTSLDEIETFWQFPDDNLGINPEEFVSEKEFTMQMKSVLEKLLEDVSLSDTQRKIISLTRQGFTNNEIAKELGISTDCVYSRRAEAVKKLAYRAKHMNTDDRGNIK